MTHVGVGQLQWDSAFLETCAAPSAAVRRPAACLPLAQQQQQLRWNHGNWPHVWGELKPNDSLSVSVSVPLSLCHLHMPFGIRNNANQKKARLSVRIGLHIWKMWMEHENILS